MLCLCSSESHEQACPGGIECELVLNIKQIYSEGVTYKNKTHRG